MVNPIAFVRRAWFSWRNRCKTVRLESSAFMTAAMAQTYLYTLWRHFEPCKVCGKLTCRWAKRIDPPRNLSQEQQENYDRMMGILSMAHGGYPGYELAECPHCESIFYAARAKMPVFCPNCGTATERLEIIQ